MFSVGNEILNGPFYPFLLRMFANMAILYTTDIAGEIQASIRMHKQLNGFTKFFFDECTELVYFRMGLVNIQVPGYGEVCIQV